MDTRRSRSRDTIARRVAPAVTLVVIGLAGCEHATLAEHSEVGNTIWRVSPA
jgi:hypothetical protein